MLQTDEFESIFRSAVREVYSHKQIELNSVLVVTDLNENAALEVRDKVKKYLRTLGDERSIEWETITGSQFQTCIDLLDKTKKISPDLICTYRNLHSQAWKYPYSLGEHLDVLVQKTSVPVLVLPHPESGSAYEHAFESTMAVMAITDHLANNHHLVTYAVKFTDPNGKLFLTHIEDIASFERFMDAISKIPTINTDDAREKIRSQLLKEPRDYIDTCISVLRNENVAIQIEPIVDFGDHLSDCRKHIEDQKINLLVMNTKDEDQLAMHGLAYPLAVEIREIPLLML